MTFRTGSARLLPLLLLAGIAASGCQTTRNFTTYYNLFYNMERIMGEVNEELLYTREQKSPEPTYHVAYDDALLRGGKVYNHLLRLSMTADESRANKIKLDSIVIKGSKLLVRNAKSDYVDDAVFYMSRSFYFQRDWYQSQKKANELIENFPDSRWLPDAHFLLAMNMLQQGDRDGALKMLSRTIDVAWARQRLDVLIDAFRLNADVYMADGNVEEALRPFKRAVALSTDNEDKARWQYEIGVVLFRSEQFDRALEAFNMVEDYSPDVLTQFQTGLQRAVTLRVLGRNDEAAKQLDKLARNGNFESWRGLVDVERLNLAATHEPGAVNDSSLAAVDSSYPGKSYGAYGIYERAVSAFRAGDYATSLSNFQKVQSMPAPFQRKAQQFAVLLGQYYEYQHRVLRLMDYPLQPFPDSIRAALADVYYNEARLFVTFQHPDSTAFYYEKSMQWAPQGSLQAARVIYARGMAARADGNIAMADSLMEILVQGYGLTEYGADARRQLGYTDYAKRDTAEDLYASGTAFMRTGNPLEALKQFHQVISRFPGSPYAPQAYYAIGLLYERDLDNRDSAFAYYSQILNLFPLSEQAETVRPIVDAVITERIHSMKSDPATQTVGGASKVALTPDGIPRLGESPALPLGQVEPARPADPGAAVGLTPGADTLSARAPAIVPPGAPSTPIDSTTSRTSDSAASKGRTSSAADTGSGSKASPATAPSSGRAGKHSKRPAVSRPKRPR